MISQQILVGSSLASCSDNFRSMSMLSINIQGSLNPSIVLNFSKLYKFIVKIVINFHCRSDTTKIDQINEQLLCGHFQFSSYPVPKFVIYLGHFQFSSYQVTRLVIYIGHFQLCNLRALKFGHVSLEKIVVTKHCHLSHILYQ